MKLKKIKKILASIGGFLLLLGTKVIGVDDITPILYGPPTIDRVPRAGRIIKVVGIIVILVFSSKLSTWLLIFLLSLYQDIPSFIEIISSETQKNINEINKTFFHLILLNLKHFFFLLSIFFTTLL